MTSLVRWRFLSTANISDLVLAGASSGQAVFTRFSQDRLLTASQ
jgi:hypothetical protein